MTGSWSILKPLILYLHVFRLWEDTITTRHYNLKLLVYQTKALKYSDVMKKKLQMAKTNYSSFHFSIQGLIISQLNKIINYTM